MDSRVAKGIAANIRDIVISSTHIALMDSGKVPNDPSERHEYHERITVAELRIAEWLIQPMTHWTQRQPTKRFMEERERNR